MFFETANGVFLPFITIVFANVYHFKALHIFVILAVIPFGGRLLRPFLFWWLGRFCSLKTISLISVGLMSGGLLFFFLADFYTAALIGLGAFSIGQGLYRIALRRDLASNTETDDINSINRLTYFMLSTVVAPIIAYPLGFWVLNTWPKKGIFLIAFIFICLLGLPMILERFYHRGKNKILELKPPVLRVSRYIPMCLITVLFVSLNSILAYSAPLILYHGTTMLPLDELVAMSISGLFGLFARKFFPFNKMVGLILGGLVFGVATIFLYLSTLSLPFSGVISIALLSFANGLVFPILLSLPTSKKWGGNLDGRFFVHSISMAIGSIITIAISSINLLNPSNVSNLTTGLFLELIIATLSIFVVIFVKP